MTLPRIIRGLIAAVLSWTVNKSVGWAILHYILGIFYIIYWIFKYSGAEEWVKVNLM